MGLIKRRWKVVVGWAFLGSLTVLLLGPLTLFGWLRGEPCYRGKPVTSWRYQLRDWRIDHWRRPENAAERLREREEKRHGVDFVVVSNYPGKWTLEHRNTWARKCYDKWQGKSNWSNPVYGTPVCRLAILDGDPAAVPVLTALLTDGDVRVRRLAAASLGRVGPQAKTAVPALLETAHRDDDAFLRGIARVAVLDIDKVAAEKAGISEHFIFWSPQPRFRGAIHGCFFLDSPVAYLAHGKMLAWDDQGATIKLHELAAGKELTCFRRPADVGSPTAFSPDAATAASASKDKKAVMLWDLATGKELAVLRGNAGAFHSLAFSPDGRTLASGADKTVQLWDVTTGKERVSLQGHEGPIACLRFSPDGKTLASGSWDRTVKVWNVPDGEEQATLQHDPTWGSVSSLAFSPDGKILASGSLDYTAKVWDVTTGKERATLKGYSDDGYVDSVAFSPDGKTLASVSWDTIFLWDVATGKNTAKILAETGGVRATTFTPDGKMLAVSRGDDHSERLWEFAQRPDGNK